MADGTRPPGASADDPRATAPAAASAAPDAILGGKYRIEREVGQGAFGRVFLALDPLLRRNVAIKELLASRNSADPSTYDRYLERFQREARAAGGLTHPNIVTVYELAVDPDANYYLVMKYVDGTDLRDLLEQVGTLPVERAVALAIEVASALAVIHEADIVHRDLKPANIMLTRRGSAKVTDFGIAQVGNESHRTQVAVGHPGTPMYMSPEQARGYGYIDGRSDLYSLGLILYEMVAGEPYARRRIPLAEKRPDLPGKLIAIVDKLMAEDPRNRYQSAEALLGDLRQLSVAPAAPSLPVGEATVVEEGATRVGTPPWGTGPSALAPGVPSAYGGAASQSQPGAQAAYPPPTAPTTEAPTRVEAAEGEGRTRIGQPGAAAPFVGVAPPVGGPPPYAGAYPPVAPPPIGPPSATSRRGLWIGVGGALVALLIVGGVIGLVMGRGGSKSVATDTPRPIARATGTPAAAAANAPHRQQQPTLWRPRRPACRRASSSRSPLWVGAPRISKIRPRMTRRRSSSYRRGQRCRRSAHP